MSVLVFIIIVCIIVWKYIRHRQQSRTREVGNSRLIFTQDSNYINVSNEPRQNNTTSNNISSPPIYYVCIDTNASASISSSSHNDFVDLKSADDLPTYEQAVNKSIDCKLNI